MGTWPLAIVLSLYLGATVLYLWSFRKRQKGRLGDTLLILAFLGHLLVFFSSAYRAQRVPLLELREGLSALSLVCVGFALFLKKKVSLEGFGAPVSLFAAVLLGMSLMLPGRVTRPPDVLDTFWFPLHTLTSFLGIGAFALAFCAGLLYLVQERMIKAKRLGNPVRSLPSLEALDRVVHFSLLFGFPLLSVGLLSGYLWARSGLRDFPWDDPKVLLAVPTWLGYGVLFYWRFKGGWRGRKVALVATLGFLAVMFTFLGVNLLLGGHHSLLTGVLR